MPTFFNEESNNAGSVPFVDVYLRENKPKNGETYELLSVTQTKAKNGYLLDFDEFKVYLPNDASLAKQLIEGLAHYCLSNTGYQIFLQVEYSAKKGYLIGVEPSEVRDWFFDSKKYTNRLRETVSIGRKKLSNPFILPAPSSPTTATRIEESEEGGYTPSRKKPKSEA
jgi:hypothetical protein